MDSLQYTLIKLNEKSYPKNLINIYDPPPELYVRGSYLPQDEKAIAIVGTRKASHYGMTIAKKLGFELASLGITIVSGMALGIDTAAHEGALSANGRTIAVLGCGLDIVYPPSNEDLMHSIISTGAVVSEFPLGTPPAHWTFPRRNRIISGLSLGVIVVEGHYKSGSMITAKLALDQGREVFAVPGNIEEEATKGPHWLIKQGAKLVESVEDVLEELRMEVPNLIQNSKTCPENIEGVKSKKEGPPRADYSNLTSDEQKIISVLSLEAQPMDNILAETKLSVPQVLNLLTMLEIKGVVKQLPGKRYVLV